MADIHEEVVSAAGSAPNTVTTEDLSFLSVDEKSICRGTLWIPQGVKPVAILHIVHGMCEHIGRYDAFARLLASRGWVVCGIDLVGHGRTEPDPTKRGVYEDPDLAAEAMIEDQRTLFTQVKARFVSLPYFMLGHSMGSFIARCFAARHGGVLSGLIVMGTAWQDSVEVLYRAVSILARLCGMSFRSHFVDALGCGGYNKLFEGTGAHTGFEWLSRDEGQVLAYAADPACGFMFSLSGYLMLAQLLREAQDVSRISKIPASLPILVISGSEDPVGEAGKGPSRVFLALRNAGVQDLSLDIIQEDRHELLNEVNRDEVEAELIAWLEARIAS